MYRRNAAREGAIADSYEQTILEVPPAERGQKAHAGVKTLASVRIMIERDNSSLSPHSMDSRRDPLSGRDGNE